MAMCGYMGGLRALGIQAHIGISKHFAGVRCFMRISPHVMKHHLNIAPPIYKFFYSEC